jgi:hypothetical protein
VWEKGIEWHSMSYLGVLVSWHTEEPGFANESLSLQMSKVHAKVRWQIQDSGFWNLKQGLFLRYHTIFTDYTSFWHLFSLQIWPKVNMEQRKICQLTSMSVAILLWCLLSRNYPSPSS